MTEVWQGVDFTINARLQNGLNLQGGISTGKTHENDCDILTALPEMRNMPAIGAANLPASQRPLQFCDRKSPYLTQAKLFGVYVIPKVEVQVSGTFRSVPGQIQGDSPRTSSSRAGRHQRLPDDELERWAGRCQATRRMRRCRFWRRTSTSSTAATSSTSGSASCCAREAPGAREHRFLQRAQFQCRGQRQPGLQPSGEAADSRPTGGRRRS